MGRKPNVVFIFSDQHRAQAVGYAGDPNVRTPHLDRLAEQSVVFRTAVACIPVCSPNRASLLTGQYPLTHGLFINDIPVGSRHRSIGEAFAEAGYDTGYIGKWHIDGHGRESFIPPERRKGFAYWRVLECTHDYNRSHYYGDADERLTWDGYDAQAQTRCAVQYIRERSRSEKPFFLVLAWGPPHDPYQTAPERFKAMYDPMRLELPPNVPKDAEADARQRLAGYYAHISALDECVGELLEALHEEGIAEETVFVYTSDHGDMLGSHGGWNKQYPYDESIRVPLVIRYPGKLGAGRTVDAPINSPDLMPTLLGLCGAAIPDTVEGTDCSGYLLGSGQDAPEGALIGIIHPFGQLPRSKGGREYRGLRTDRYTYVRDLDGPWLLFDNRDDPYQLDNLCGRPQAADVQKRLDEQLNRLLAQRSDPFLAGEAHCRAWGYVTDPETGKVIERLPR